MTRVAAQPSLVEQVCSRLSAMSERAQAANDGWLPPERQLAEQLSVSRTVIREATKRLELQGVLEVRHGVGIRFVDRPYAPVSGALELLLPEADERLRQLAEARVTIEPQMARLAAERATAKHRRALDAAQQRLAAAVETSQAIEADLEFHRILAQAAGNRILEVVLESLGELGRASRQATLASTGVARALEHHAAILDAVERRQGPAAHDAMLIHVQASANDLARFFGSASGSRRRAQRIGALR